MTAEKSNNHLNDFDLFQDQNDYSSKILADANKIKKEIQEYYKILYIGGGSNSDYWLFDFDVHIHQVAEQPEPNSLKLFTRQYVPVVRVYCNNEPKGNLIIDTSETKIINKYINELFVGDSVSQEYFFDIAKQYFLLDFVYKLIVLDSANFVSKINKEFSEYNNSDNTVIHVNCKLRGRDISSRVNPNLYSAICHINKIWDNLYLESKFVIVGSYRNYSRENELIMQLSEIKLDSGSNSIANYFQNDFLLLNNMEFMDEDHYTREWNDIILSPLLIEKKNDSLGLKDSVTGLDLYKNIFLYQKIKEDSIFYKTEIVLPLNKRNNSALEQAILLSKEILKLKQIEE